MGSIGDIITQSPKNKFAPYTLHPRIKILRPLEPLASRLLKSGVIQERAHIGVRDVEFIKKLNSSKDVLDKEVERVQKDVLNKMGIQNDIDKIHVGRESGRWSPADFEQVKDNFLISMSVSKEEMAYIIGLGVPLCDPIVCARLRTRRCGDTVATVATWYEDFETFLPVLGLKRCPSSGILLLDVEKVKRYNRCGNVSVVNLIVKSPEALSYVNKRYCHLN